MGDDAVFAAQQRRVTEQLGAAMLAAVGLMVRQYLGAPTGENEGQDSADAAWEDGAQAFRAGETVNESFDMARYLRLRQGASGGGAGGERGPRRCGGPFAERKADDRKNDIRAHGGGGRRRAGKRGTERIRCRAGERRGKA